MNKQSPRTKRAEMARETLNILQAGGYKNRRGLQVDLKEDIQYCVNHSQLFRPAEVEKIWRERTKAGADKSPDPTSFEVRNESSLYAARRLIAEGFSNPLCLNFASARNPGGGFLNGSEAQEESLARSSALYLCLEPMQEMYETNRREKSGLYTDYMIYSPKVPVIRNDSGQLLEQPELVSFITAPAVNATVAQADSFDKIATTMQQRIGKILAIAEMKKHDALILGAYGCGVFGNDPQDVAEYFAGHLLAGGLFYNAFARVVFAVFDKSSTKSNFNAFKNRFHNA